MSIGRSKSVAGASASHAPASGENGSTQPQTVTPLAGATRRRRNSGLLCELQSMCKRTLRAASQTIIFPFYSKTGTTPTRAQPKPDVVPALKPAPRRMRPPAAPGRKHQRNVDAVVPPAMATSPRAEIRFPLTTADAQRYLRAQWRQAETGGRFDQAAVDRLTTTLTARLLATSAATGNGVHEDSGEKACARAIMVSDALAQATGGDPARAHDALLALLDTTSHADARVQADVLALQTALGMTAIGLDTLLAIAPHVLPQRGLAEGSAAPEIQREALRHALRAADHLLRRKPADAPGPTSLETLAALADPVLPAVERGRPGSSAAASTAPPGKAPAWLADPGNALAIKALHAANALRADPAAQCPPHLAQAYLAWRNRFDREGPGTDLAKAQQRLFKLFTYAERAARTGMAARAAAGFFGTQKSPLSALQNFGTAGVMLGHPDDEFARFTAALAPVKTQLADRLKAASTSRALKTRCAVRLAAIEQWERRMASKGLRSTFRFSSRDLEAVAARARPLLSNRVALHADGSPADLALDPHRNRDAIRAEVKPLRGMTPAQLRTWADEAWRLSGQAVPEPVRANIDLVESRLAGDIRPKPGDTNAQLDAIGALVKQMPDIYDIRVSSGGTVGLGGVPSQSLAALSSHLGVPHVSVLPDGGYLQGRHAVIDIGSNQHFGHLFIGTESRKSLYGGLGGYAGWSFGQDGMANVGVSGGLRRSRDWGGPRGVTIRTRRSDDEQPGRPDAWRTTMLEVLHAARSAGPNSDAPRNAREMWGSLARRFWNDPACSINWTDSRSTTSATSGSASATARVGTADTKWGPALGATLRHVARAAHRQWYKTGNHAIDVSTHNSGRATAVAATLVEALPGIPVPNGSGHLAALSFPTQPYVGIGTTLFTTQTNAALRIGRDSGRIIPKHTFRDTEFGTFKAFKQFVDTHRSEWLTALGGTDEARRRLDEMVATVKARATAGNLIMGERMHMTDEAARRLDFLFHRKQHFDRIPAPTPVQARERASIDADIRQMLASENSWRRQALYVLEALGVQRTVGLSFLLNAQSTQAVSGVRELAGLSPE
ncbi:hypothetical protein [Ralstonia pseudosolanacearum]|uniref:hypothetical protein n=1 Tax=Ralstonia pseudosolanacearum TaxID=1310165 RepID=UPI003D00E334